MSGSILNLAAHQQHRQQTVRLWDMLAFAKVNMQACTNSYHSWKQRLGSWANSMSTLSAGINVKVTVKIWSLDPLSCKPPYPLSPSSNAVLLNAHMWSQHHPVSILSAGYLISNKGCLPKKVPCKPQSPCTTLSLQPPLATLQGNVKDCFRWDCFHEGNSEGNLKHFQLHGA